MPHVKSGGMMQGNKKPAGFGWTRRGKANWVSLEELSYIIRRTASPPGLSAVRQYFSSTSTLNRFSSGYSALV